MIVVVLRIKENCYLRVDEDHFHSLVTTSLENDGKYLKNVGIFFFEFLIRVKVRESIRQFNEFVENLNFFLYCLSCFRTSSVHSSK